MDEQSGLSHWEGEASMPAGKHYFRLRHVVSRSPAKQSREVKRNGVASSKRHRESFMQVYQPREAWEKTSA